MRDDSSHPHIDSIPYITRCTEVSPTRARPGNTCQDETRPQTERDIQGVALPAAVSSILVSILICELKS
ncbi:hypothetical protein CKAH01_04099 [Colletotrichum kahawae]|uniref:Uncharacterized protein n=1 Tax=Colletotrichum kahawae TaxID=34407 RepID=A0AAD9YM70_COLKA|nr:hypothetical protein CKAH01_04099 [Colletotrichum kahawae]